MFKKCKYCNNLFIGSGYFCSDVCEIKNHASENMISEKDTIAPETKEEFAQDSKNLLN